MISRIKNFKPGIVTKPWGSFENLKHTKDWHVKIVYVKEGEMLSLQSHKKREEYWFIVEGAIIAENHWEKVGVDKHILKVGQTFRIYKENKHRMSAYKGDATVVEISLGEFDEADIKRYEDKYGRK